jgi:segregation and condensation protein B
MTREPPDESKSADATLGLDAFRQLPEPTGPSLNELSAAFAGMLGQGDDPYALRGADGPSEAQVESAAADAVDACQVTPRSILEAMLFVGHPQNEPLTSKQVAGLMRGVRPAEIDSLVRELNRDYAARGCPYMIVAEGPGYRLTLCDEYAAVRDKFHAKARQARLSQAAIEVLAAVAYNAPITADEVSRLRGMPSGHVLLQLVRRQLLRLERGEGQSRGARYYTTDRFLELFGLASLEDLPRSHDLEEFRPESASWRPVDSNPS